MSTSEILPALPACALPVPAIIAGAGAQASEHFLEFFAANIRNKNTRTAYVQAAAQFFDWCEGHSLQLATIRPLHMAAYLETKTMSPLRSNNIWRRCASSLTGSSSSK